MEPKIHTLEPSPWRTRLEGLARLEWLVSPDGPEAHGFVLTVRRALSAVPSRHRSRWSYSPSGLI